MIFECAKCGHVWKSKMTFPNHCANPKCQSRAWETGINKKSGRKQNTIDKFLKKIIKTDGCWLWGGTISNHGVGMFKLDGKYRQAYRIAYELFIGEIPEGMNVCHKCDNPGCVNPDHFFIGTTQDNVADRVAKGRSAIAEKNWNTKLTREQVLMIRNSDFSSHGSKSKLARELGVSQTALNYVLTGKNWRHL